MRAWVGLDIYLYMCPWCTVHFLSKRLTTPPEHVSFFPTSDHLPCTCILDLQAMDYRHLLAKLTSLQGDNTCGDALSKLIKCGLLCTEEFSAAVIGASLEKACAKYSGAMVLCYVQYTSNQYEAVAAYKDGSKLVMESRPIQVIGTLLRDGKHELQLFYGSATLFRVPTWIARTVFSLKDHLPYPFLSHAACLQHGLGAGALDDMCYTPLTLTNIVRQLELVVGATARLCQGIDSSEASVIDVLHCFGVVYVGSLNEAKSKSEISHLSKALEEVTKAGFKSMWWIEDFTLFKPNMYTLVFRFNHPKKGPYYQRRQLLQKTKTQLIDLQTSNVSPPLIFHEGSGKFHFQEFNVWISSILGVRSFPYMRNEIVDRFTEGLVRPEAFQWVMRPYLKNGVKCHLPVIRNSELPPRLFYSWDLFLEPSRFPPGTNPSTVHFVIEIKSWVDDPDFRLLLRIDGDEDYVYRLFFREDGESFPEGDQLKVHVECSDPSMFLKDAINVVILRRSFEPYGTTVVEFTLTTFYKPFKLYVDSRVCDLALRAMVFNYLPESVPKVLQTVMIPVFTHRVQLIQDKQGVPYAKAVQRTLDKIQCQRQRELIPIFLGKSVENKSYEFIYWDGGNLVLLS